MKIKMWPILSLTTCSIINFAYAIDPPKTLQCTQQNKYVTLCQTNHTVFETYNATPSMDPNIDYVSGTYQLINAQTDPAPPKLGMKGAQQLDYTYAHLNGSQPDKSKTFIMTMGRLYDKDHSIKPDLNDNHWKAMSNGSDPLYHCIADDQSLCPFTNTPYVNKQNTYDNGLSITNNTGQTFSVYPADNKQSSSWSNTDYATSHLLPYSKQQVAYVDTPTTPAQNQRFVLRVHMDSPCTDTGSTRNNLDVLIYYVTDVGGTFHREIFPDSEDFVCSGKSYVIAPDNQAGPSEVANMTISN